MPLTLIGPPTPGCPTSAWPALLVVDLPCLALSSDLESNRANIQVDLDTVLIAVAILLLLLLACCACLRIMVKWFGAVPAYSRLAEPQGGGSRRSSGDGGELEAQTPMTAMNRSKGTTLVATRQYTGVLTYPSAFHPPEDVHDSFAPQWGDARKRPDSPPRAMRAGFRVPSLHEAADDAAKKRAKAAAELESRARSRVARAALPAVAKAPGTASVTGGASRSQEGARRGRLPPSG